MDQDKRDRLIQLLGMMGSAFDGEVLNAARLAQRLLGSEGVTWEEVMNGGPYTEEAVRTVITEAYDKGMQEGITKGIKFGREQAVIAKPRRTWQSYARELRDDYQDYLSEWEQGFVESFIDKAWATPTPKQKAIFERLSEKTGTDTP